jgi:hypothetical protein
MVSFSLRLVGQSEYGDSTSNDFVARDTVISENTLKTQDLQVEKTLETVPPTPLSPSMHLTIPMYIPGMKASDLMMSPKYWEYENAITGFIYTNPIYDPWQMTLNLNLKLPKRLLDLIRENPFIALIYGVTTLAGMANHNVVGEDKMNIIRLDNMVQSRSGIPQTAIIIHGPAHFENEYKKIK